MTEEFYATSFFSNLPIFPFPSYHVELCIDVARRWFLCLRACCALRPFQREPRPRQISAVEPENENLKFQREPRPRLISAAEPENEILVPCNKILQLHTTDSAAQVTHLKCVNCNLKGKWKRTCLSRSGRTVRVRIERRIAKSWVRRSEMSRNSSSFARSPLEEFEELIDLVARKIRKVFFEILLQNFVFGRQNVVVFAKLFHSPSRLSCQIRALFSPLLLLFRHGSKFHLPI